MTFGVVLPALVVAITASLAGIVPWPLRPRVALRLLAVIAAVSSTTVFFIAFVGVLGIFSRSAMMSSLMSWCPAVPSHHEMGIIDGAAAVLIVAAAVWRIRRVVQRHRWAMSGTEGRRLAVLDIREPVAYAVPGTPGCVVVSQGMLDALDSNERRVLFAHERAHLDEHHHRYLLIGELAVAVLPTLRPLSDQLRLATERCADEAAVAAVGQDRRLVARSIARAALSAGTYNNRSVGAFGGGSVSRRVRALLGPPPSVLSLRVGAAMAAVFASTALAAGGVQLHHVVGLIEHVCHS